MKRLFTMTLLVSGTILVALATGGCGGSSESLENTTWILAEYATADGSLTETLATTEIDATFAEGEVVGTGGCNSYRGTYEVDGDSLSFSPLASTMMACEQSIMDQETAFHAAMNAVVTYEIDNDSLVLKNEAGDTVLVFNQSAE